MPAINSSATGGGLWYVTVIGNNVAGGGTPFGFIANVAGPGPFVAANPWLKGCNIQMYTEDKIQSGGSIDSHTIFQGPVTVSVPAGATDASHHF
jgi:hypothetical protein